MVVCPFLLLSSIPLCPFAIIFFFRCSSWHTLVWFLVWTVRKMLLRTSVFEQMSSFRHMLSICLSNTLISYGWNFWVVCKVCNNILRNRFTIFPCGSILHSSPHCFNCSTSLATLNITISVLNFSFAQTFGSWVVLYHDFSSHLPEV